MTALKPHHGGCKRKFVEKNGQTILNLQPIGEGGCDSSTWKFDQHEARLV